MAQDLKTKMELELFKHRNRTIKMLISGQKLVILDVLPIDWLKFVNLSKIKPPVILLSYPQIKDFIIPKFNWEGSSGDRVVP